MEYEILVIGIRADGIYGAFWANYTDADTGIEPHPTLEPGGGGSSPPPTHEFSHTATCGSEDGAAAQVADTIKATDDLGPNLFDWTDAEYVATIIEKSPGVFAAYNDTVYSLGQINDARMTAPEISSSVQGLIHNHPLALDDNTENPQLQQRYPSTGDWDALDRLHERYGPTQSNFDPTIWILDSFGVTRRFARSERVQFDSLGTDDREAGEGLDGREVVDDDC